MLIRDLEENMRYVVGKGEKDKSIDQHICAPTIIFREQKYSACTQKHILFNTY